MCLGAGRRGKRAYSGRRGGTEQSAGRCGPTPARAILLATGGARACRGARMKFEDEPVPGYPLPILPGHTSPGRFERVLRAGQFAVTSELAPPDSADPEDVFRRARVFHGYVDAINATDGSGANCHMSSLAVRAPCSTRASATRRSCRYPVSATRTGSPSRATSSAAAAMGVCNILCLTGDGVNAGDHPQALPVFDLDSMTSLPDDRTHLARRASVPERAQDHLRSARAAGCSGESVHATRASGERSAWRRK